MAKTFLFFDLETTGLLTKTSMPKITELSLIAVSRDAIRDETVDFPRVLHKLTIPIDPNTFVSEQIYEITGLSNENLKAAQHFSCDTYNLLMNFIKLQTAPVCFVAYNGNVFDYPIFLSELDNINKSLGEDILCVDMLHTIQHFFSNRVNRPDNFKLSTVYKHIIGTDPENAHSAEGDCITMIRLVKKLADAFLEWADEKHVPLTTFSQPI